MHSGQYRLEVQVLYVGRDRADLWEVAQMVLRGSSVPMR